MIKTDVEICKALSDINDSVKELKPKEKSKPKVNNVMAIAWIATGVALIYALYRICF
ncbi:MAG: hypothetical protein RR620_06830 [Clostridium sp.]